MHCIIVKKFGKNWQLTVVTCSFLWIILKVSENCSFLLWKISLLCKCCHGLWVWDILPLYVYMCIGIAGLYISWNIKQWHENRKLLTMTVWTNLNDLSLHVVNIDKLHVFCHLSAESGFVEVTLFEYWYLYAELVSSLSFYCFYLFHKLLPIFFSPHLI